jgi:hypothetical protein|tara:strand:+ start:199 stop:1071 length:873 start_codon:yes stop_codon:yes gene_type:complete
MSTWIDLSSSSGAAYTASTVTEISGYVFDLFEMDVSMTVDPSYATAILDASGFNTVDAVATIDMSASSFSNLFFITVDSSDIDNTPAEDIVFSIDPSFVNPFTNPTNLAFSEAVVKGGGVNPNYIDQRLKKDVVRHIAFSITGGYAVADIFANEDELLTDIVNRDDDIHEDISAAINTLLADAAGAGGGRTTDQFANGTTDAVKRFYNVAQSLWALSSNDGNRIGGIHTLLAANSDENSLTTTIPLQFAPGDAIAIRVNYIPATAHPNTVPGMGTNTINERSYKIIVVLS